MLFHVQPGPGPSSNWPCEVLKIYNVPKPATGDARKGRRRRGIKGLWQSLWSMPVPHQSSVPLWPRPRKMVDALEFVHVLADSDARRLSSTRLSTRLCDLVGRVAEARAGPLDEPVLATRPHPSRRFSFMLPRSVPASCLRHAVGQEGISNDRSLQKETLSNIARKKRTSVCSIRKDGVSKEEPQVWQPPCIACRDLPGLRDPHRFY